MSDKKPKEDPPPEPDVEDQFVDDPLGIGVDSTTLYIIIGVCVCIFLLISIGLIFVLTSASSSSGSSGSNNGNGGSDCCTVPSHYTIELKYGDGVNPYNNFSLPPVIPKPPQYFG